MGHELRVSFLVIIFFFSFTSICTVNGDHNYSDALSKSILFFEGQRSGKLPSTQTMKWRGDSAVDDGSLADVDLSGGYYDAGDNVKFNFPMAFTTTMLSWNVLEHGRRLGPELQNARAAIRWAADYLLKCVTAAPGQIFVGVGDPNSDHTCWERPEDMDTVRSVYSISSERPGSDVAGEMAAALAAASLVFRRADPAYSKKLLGNSVDVFWFAVQYEGKYSDQLKSAVCPFYCSYSGFKDELMWGAAWLLRATNDDSYYEIIKALTVESPDNFSWDNKVAGAYVLLSRRSLFANGKKYQNYAQLAEDFMCKILPDSPSLTTHYTNGGLMYKLPQSNLQYVTSISSLTTTYAKYMAFSKKTFNCNNLVVTHNTLRSFVKKQVDYILGDNPLKMSYMVGYGPNYPKRIHHRASSIPSTETHSNSDGCHGFESFFSASDPNPNILTGAIVGGPDQDDNFPDDRTDYSHSEPATYINACVVGPLAYFANRLRS